MTSIAVDSGVLYALFDIKDRNRSRASAIIAQTRRGLVTNVAVLTETVYLLRFSGEAQRDFLRFAGAVLELDTGIAADLPRIVEFMEKYADLPADFADASLLALCERRGIAHIATFDLDFNVYKLNDGSQLINVMAVHP